MNRRRTLASCAALAVTALITVSACSSSTSRASHSSAPGGPTVDTTSGRLHGLTTSTAREFLGVRYAKPPTGSRRWTLPVAAPKAAGTVAATKPGPSCAQAGSAPGASSTASTNEDCLFLNVTTPKDARSGDTLPVVVWWHGGGFTSGSGGAYDAQRFASSGHVVVVAVNYRLGVFGYLSLPGLQGSGDFGLADQILATRWAKINAKAFGGDPANITVMGESAGAMSACALLTSPAAKGLVDKVVLSSGGTCRLNWPRDGLVPGAPASTPYVPLSAGEQLGVTEAKQLGCTGSGTLACLRGKTTKEALKIFPVFSDVLAYDTSLLPQDPAAAVDAGKALPIPVISGNNRDEERAFVGGVQKAKKVFTAQSYPTFVARAFGSHAAKVLAQYPLSQYRSAALAWATLITDASWACPTLRGNAALAAHGSRVFGNEFADADPPDVNMVDSSQVPSRDAHATDLPYYFDIGGKSLLRTVQQRRLAATMIDYVSSFARTGTPKADGSPAWPRLTGPDGPTLQYAPTVRTVDFSAEHRCDFWSGISW